MNSFVHFSNTTKQLYKELKQQLFKDSSPFTKRIVVVPSPAMKSWLKIEMARDPDLQIASGYSMEFMEPAIKKIYALCGGCVKPVEATELDLALAIESTLSDLRDHPEFASICTYLGLTEATPTKKREKRMATFSSTLATCFSIYGIYGEQIVLQEQWPKNRHSDWQQIMWRRIEEKFGPFHYPLRYLNIAQLKKEEDLQIHLFALSFLPPIYHKFFQTLGTLFPIHHYVLSPCQKFWSDLVTFKEGERIKQYWKSRGASLLIQEELDLYLRSSNALLANYGKLGRRSADSLEDGAGITERYTVPKSVVGYVQYQELLSDEIFLEERNRSLTLLEAVQADMLLLRQPNRSEKIPFSSYDHTIQVHAVPKKMREVEVIYDALLAIIQRHNSEAIPLFPGDIVVMAPSIAEYAPFIRAVFGAKESQLPIELLDTQVAKNYPIVQGFLDLLSLSHGRWESSKVLQLFDCKAFQSRFQLSGSDVTLIRRWIKDVGIHWGRDHAHRRSTFEKEYQSIKIGEEEGTGTWACGLGRLIEGIAKDTGDPFYTVDDRLLNQLIQIITSIQADLHVLTQEEKKTVDEWGTYLSYIFQTYFFSHLSEEDEEGADFLMKALQTLSSRQKVIKETFPFSTIYHHLTHLLEKEVPLYKEVNSGAIRFTSLLPMRAVPARVIVLMGMGDGFYPRKNSIPEINVLSGCTGHERPPDPIDFDRYLFLEMLLSARDYFLVSYGSQRPGELGEELPSNLVTELLAYLDQAFSLSNASVTAACQFSHPLNSFHPSYFSKESRFKTYRRTHYQAALAAYGQEKRNERSFFERFMVPLQEVKAVGETVVIKDLVSLAKNPLKFYLNKGLGIYFRDTRDEEPQDREGLFLSDLDAHLFLKEEVRGRSAIKVKQLPCNPFRMANSKKLEELVHSTRCNIEELGLSGETFFSFEFSEGVTIPFLEEDVWHLPPLLIAKKYLVVGVIEDITSQGMSLFAEESMEKVIANWPLILSFFCALRQFSLPSAPALFFLRGDKPQKKVFSLENPEALLENYIEYYFMAKQAPSPLKADWVPAILSSNVEVLRKWQEEEETGYNYQGDLYTTWIEQQSPALDFSTALAWKGVAESLFEPIVET